MNKTMTVEASGPGARSLPWTLVSGIFQIGYVTTDVDEAVKVFAETYGVSKFRVSRGVSLQGTPKLTLNQAHAYGGEIQVELNQPAGGDDKVYRDSLPKEGFAIRFHHFGYMLDSNEEFDRTLETVKARNLPIVLEASMPNARAIYADARTTVGHYLEYVFLAPELRQKYYANVPRN